MVTEDLEVLDRVQALYEEIWSGRACPGCGRRDRCEAPLDL
jgi:hypothetical protein